MITHLRLNMLVTVCTLLISMGETNQEVLAELKACSMLQLTSFSSLHKPLFEEHLGEDKVRRQQFSGLPMANAQDYRLGDVLKCTDPAEPDVTKILERRGIPLQMCAGEDGRSFMASYAKLYPKRIATCFLANFEKNSNKLMSASMIGHGASKADLLSGTASHVMIDLFIDCVFAQNMIPGRYYATDAGWQPFSIEEIDKLKHYRNEISGKPDRHDRLVVQLRTGDVINYAESTVDDFLKSNSTTGKRSPNGGCYVVPGGSLLKVARALPKSIKSVTIHSAPYHGKGKAAATKSLDYLHAAERMLISSLTSKVEIIRAYAETAPRDNKTASLDDMARETDADLISLLHADWALVTEASSGFGHIVFDCRTSLGRKTDFFKFECEGG